MKIDELISELEEVRSEHGNLEVQKYVDQYSPGRSPLENIRSQKYTDKTGDADQEVIVLLMD